MSDQNKNLYYLDELPDYQVAADYSDVRGWEVVDAHERVIGKVDNLLVNKNQERVVYLDVEVNNSIIEAGHDIYQIPVIEGIHGFLNKDGETHLIIPIGMASLDEKNKKVITYKIDYSTFAKTKRFRKGEDVDFGYEADVLRHYVGNQKVEENPVSGSRFYERDEFDISKT